MDKNIYKPTWHRAVLVILLLGLGFFTIISLAKPGAAYADLSLPASPEAEIQTQPVLTPTYTTLCGSNWYTLTVADLGGQTAYLTRSVSDPAKSTNSGEWRPDLTQTGVYSVSAFVPAHDIITWCNDQTISRDTYSANYTIHYMGGQKNVKVNQFPLNNDWYPLGIYSFSQGKSGYVHLSDLTTDTITRTVAFSAVRFTYLHPILPHIFYFPLVSHEPAAINLTQAWTADDQGSPASVFLPNGPMRYYAAGTNSATGSIDAGLKMTLAGPCNGGSIFDGTQTFASGSWTTYKTVNAPNCVGVFTLTVSVTVQDKTTTLSSPFIVSASTVALKNIPAFDKCSIPTPAQMQTWWDHSPYAAVNLYIGGESLASCATGLNANWVQTVSQQGWTFIPTWVGLQAPCFGYKHPMSSKESVAYTQGRSAADAAANAAAALGFNSQSILYYDLESYANANATTGCRNAVKSFLKGWVTRLHERGARAGAYGGDCTSYVNDWYTINPLLDDVWIANWNTNPGYDPDASVYDLTCLTDDSRWADHRIRQYAGEFKDSYGGLRMTIDADVVNGEVTAIPLTQKVGMVAPDTPGLIGAGTSNLLLQQAKISDFKPIAAGQGWAQVGSQLWWYSAGQIWQDITPGHAPSSKLLAAFFLDTHKGWAILRDVESGQITLYSTVDTGVSWHPALIPGVNSLPVASVSLDFLDSQTGWLSFKLASGSSFSRGILLKTGDGGKSWTKEELPVAGPVRFVDANQGWIAGGPAGDELYRTQDGGTTWQPQQLDLGQDIASQSYMSLPTFSSPSEGWLVVTVSNPLKPHVDLFTTADAGKTWDKRVSVSLDPAFNPASAAASVLLDGERWLLANPSQPAIYPLQPGTLGNQNPAPTLSISSLPVGAAQIINATSRVSWALVQQGDCRGYKPKPGEPAPLRPDPFTCSSSTSLWQTTDGGATWENISPGFGPKNGN